MDQLTLTFLILLVIALIRANTRFALLGFSFKHLYVFPEPLNILL